MTLPIDDILNPGQVRLYFADFYCNKKFATNKLHYVTLVLCKRGSQADEFCEGRLLSFDLFDNPFLRVEFQQKADVFSREGRQVNIRYLVSAKPNFAVEVSP